MVFGLDENILPYEEAFRAAGKKLVFEWPGQDLFIVFADADLDLALDDLMTSKFMYSGQTCTAPKRIFIQANIYQEFLTRFVERVRRLVVGDPADTKTDIGPVVSTVAVRRLHEQMADALEKGAKVLVGGRIEGKLVYPTVVKDCADDMLGMREEVFAPVAFTSRFETAGEVLARAKNHKYGLRAAVYGGSEAAGVAKELLGAITAIRCPRTRLGSSVRSRVTRGVRNRGTAHLSPSRSAGMAIPVGSGTPWTDASRSSRGQSC